MCTPVKSVLTRRVLVLAGSGSACQGSGDGVCGVDVVEGHGSVHTVHFCVRNGCEC
jgi:hypothetical protein